MPIGSVSGREIKRVRFDLKLNQPKFAEWLSQNTGEKVTSLQVCRMENFGKKGACHPLPPSAQVVNVILPFRSDKSDQPLKNVSKSTAKYSDLDSDTVQDFSKQPSGSGHKQPEVNQKLMENEMNEQTTQRQSLMEIAGLYEDLGLFEASGNSALEMIESIETSIRNQEHRLVGDVVFDERQDIQSRLLEISEERAKIKIEQQQIEAELEVINKTVEVSG